MEINLQEIEDARLVCLTAARHREELLNSLLEAFWASDASSTDGVVAQKYSEWLAANRVLMDAEINLHTAVSRLYRARHRVA